MTLTGAAARFRARLRFVSNLALVGTVVLYGAPLRSAAGVWERLPGDVQVAVLALAWVAGIMFGIRALVRQMFSPLDSDA